MKALADRSHVWLFWLLAVVGLAADQGSKYGIFAWLYNDGTPCADEAVLGSTIVTSVKASGAAPRDPYGTRELKLVPGFFDIVASHTQQVNEESGPIAILREVSGEHLPYVNRGALFGWGGGHGDGADLNTLFAVVSFLAALGITYWSTRPATRRDRILCAALGLILAGTMGNLYDRIVFSGVRDFLHWYKWYDWPVFNIADCCLVCGAGLLLAHAFFTVEEEAHQKNAAVAVAVPAQTMAEAPAETATAQQTSPVNG
jgi:lipoprotein signal peptidase